MNLNIKIFLLCPIPDDQKPITEYINLKENNFTNLMLLSRKNYFSKIFINFLTCFVISTPLSFVFKVNNDLLLFNSFYAISFLILIFVVNLSLTQNPSCRWALHQGVIQRHLSKFRPKLSRRQVMPRTIIGVKQGLPLLPSPLP